jgi:hypothetical protein
MDKKEDHFEKYASRFVSIFLIVAVFSGYLKMKHELEADFEAIHYLETQGYSSVRILQQTAEGHGCQPSDTYHFLFDATSPQGKGTEGIACFNGMSWYEE